MPQIDLHLKDFRFDELQTVAGLTRLDEQFIDYLSERAPSLREQLIDYRAGTEFSRETENQFLLACAPYLETFIADLYQIEDEVSALRAATLSHDPVFAFKEYFVLRQAKRAVAKQKEALDFKSLDQWLQTQLQIHNLLHADRELAVAQFGQRCLQKAEEHASDIEQLTQWCVAAITTDRGRAAVNAWMSFKLPNKLNYTNLVPVEPVKEDAHGRLQSSPDTWRLRDGFKLTDQRMSSREVLNEIHYCVYCHKNDGDFCSKGFPVKRSSPELGLKINPVGETLTGCPLEEKISEMHALKRDGFGVAALAMVMVDNPMCPATGHRICNDCMKACIYQKQDPVNIPEAETRILTDVLNLPWGVEIYDLLTRWNPLRRTQWLPKPYNGLKAFVMGMGPAGFTMAHHLLMEGFAIVGADGLKLEPLPDHYFEKPIREYDQLCESLDDRVMTGFGGVAEYGITVRWDKNFLKLIYLSLMRRRRFQLFGSIRFGGTLTVPDVWQLGFDHLVLAVGAGLPRELAIPNSLAPGMRQANDFLMALQLTGAAKRSSLANLQVRLPAVVIGGGLTGVDTATEVQAYYIAQVEKVAMRYDRLVEHDGEVRVRDRFDAHSLSVIDEFLQHARAVTEERERARRENREPNFIPLLRAWGGVTIAYRRTMQESPAYKRNHEEVIKALEEGIYYVEGLEPSAVILDRHGWVKALRMQVRVQDAEGEWMNTDAEETLPARSIFVATGARPNVAYEFEHKGTFTKLHGNYERYKDNDTTLEPVTEKGHVKMPEFGAFTSYQNKHRLVSFIGDTHPVFHGSVVKAIASAKRTYPFVAESLREKIKAGDHDEYAQFSERMENHFRARVKRVISHGKRVVELEVHAPAAARNFAPGQFYRIQNYERLAPMLQDTRLQTEALALIGFQREMNSDTLNFFVIERGASSRLVRQFRPDMPLSVMGPTGARSSVPDEPQTLLVLGGQMAIAHFLSIAPTMTAAGHQLIFVGCFKEDEEIFCRDDIERLADQTLWLDASLFDATDQLTTLPLARVHRFIVVGRSELIRELQRLRQTHWQGQLHPEARFFAAVHGPMQCMLKGVCAQCLQWQIDPKTGERKKAVYACSWQNQPLELIDIQNIDERLAQNRALELLSDYWLSYLSQ